MPATAPAPWHLEDAPARHEAVRESVGSVGRWLPWCHAGYGPDEAQAWVRQCREGWAAGELFAFGIFERSTQGLLGSVGLNQPNREHHGATGCARRARAKAWPRAPYGLSRASASLHWADRDRHPADNHASRRTAGDRGRVSRRSRDSGRGGATERTTPPSIRWFPAISSRRCGGVRVAFWGVPGSSRPRAPRG